VTLPRRQLLLLCALAVAVAAFVVVRWSPNGAGNAGTSARTEAGSQATRAVNPVGDIKLESLDRHDDAWSTPDRDVFRFENKRETDTASAAPRAPVNPEPVATAPRAPAVPPPPPPIPLRYIGYLDQAGAPARVAVLSDGKGNVFNGREGDIIEGRYRVVRVGTDSAELMYLDGRGRQTIRLSGQ
jgi:hypothetical protein